MPYYENCLKNVPTPTFQKFLNELSRILKLHNEENNDEFREGQEKLQEILELGKQVPLESEAYISKIELFNLFLHLKLFDMFWTWLIHNQKQNPKYQHPAAVDDEMDDEMDEDTSDSCDDDPFPAFCYIDYYEDEE